MSNSRKEEPNFVELDERNTSHDAAEPLRPRCKRCNAVVEDGIEEKEKPYHEDIDFASKKGQLPLPENCNSDRPKTPPGFWDPLIIELQDDDPRNTILPAPRFKKRRRRVKKAAEKEELDDNGSKKPFYPELTFASGSKD